MVTTSYKIAEARSHFSELLKRVQQGEEILIIDDNEPVARLVPVEKQGARRPGILRELLTEAEAAALLKAMDLPLSDREQRILEGEGTDGLGIWTGFPEHREKVDHKGDA